MWWNWIMHFVSGHKRPAGRGSVLDGAVRGAAAKMREYAMDAAA